MEHQFRRGIYRPNAQRLSISLAPLVAQRSLMFRVKTDLAAGTSYAELTPTEESPALFTLCGSAQIASTVLTAMSAAISTAMSSASVYSQDSWEAESPFVPPVIKVDPRRMAIAFSPSVRWSDMADDSDKEPAMQTPLVQSGFTPGQAISFSEIKEDDDGETYSEPDTVPLVTTNAVPQLVGSVFGSPNPVEKKFTKIKPMNKEIGLKSSTTFHKVMAHLAFQPPKREYAQLRRADAVVAISSDLPSMNFKLPEFQVSPMRYSFITQTNTTDPSAPPMSRAHSSRAPSSRAPLDTLVEDDRGAVDVRLLRATVPPPQKKDHRRLQSSPPVPHFRRYGKDNIPPPSGPRPLRARSFKPTLLRAHTIASHGPVNISRPLPLAF